MNSHIFASASRSLTDERGSILVISLLILLVLSMLGAVASNMSSTEMRLAANERTYNQAFYVNEAVWQKVPAELTWAHRYDPPKEDVLTGKVKQAAFNGKPQVNTLNSIPYSFDTTYLGVRKATGGWGMDSDEYYYQVDTSTYDPAFDPLNPNPTPRQQLRVVVSKVYGSRYGN